MRVEKTDVYRDWIDALKDRAGRARILVRVDRLILLLLAGGDKSAQQKDIERAIQLARHFVE